MTDTSGYNGPNSPQYGENADEADEPAYEQLGEEGNPFTEGEEGLAERVTTAESMESSEAIGEGRPNPMLPDGGPSDGTHEGEQTDHNYEQGAGGT